MNHRDAFEVVLILLFISQLFLLIGQVFELIAYYVG